MKKGIFYTFLSLMNVAYAPDSEQTLSIAIFRIKTKVNCTNLPVLGNEIPVSIGRSFYCTVAAALLQTIMYLLGRFSST